MELPSTNLFAVSTPPLTHNSDVEGLRIVDIDIGVFLDDEDGKVDHDRVPDLLEVVQTSAPVNGRTVSLVIWRLTIVRRTI